MNLHIPYRTRKALQRVFLVVLVIAVALAMIWAFWMLWLQRYVIYTRDEGAKIDFSLNPQLEAGAPVKEPENPTVSIYYNEGDNAINTSKEMTQLGGYYISTEDLENNMDELKTQIRNLPAGTPVMVEVKSIKGNFFYSSGVASYRSSSVDTEKMDELLKFLDKSGMYTIAYLPALRDYNYGLNNVPDGLPTAGGWLWIDDDGCYWLNPSSQGTVAYLVQIINELKALGFDEVALYDFYFPVTDSVVFSGDKTEALSAAAKTLVTTCATDYFAVSFVMDQQFTLPEGSCRMYKRNATAADAVHIAAESGLADPHIRLVFLTDNHDTRFDAYGVLRPLSAAH